MQADLEAALELSAAIARLQRTDERYAHLFRDLRAAMRDLRAERDRVEPDPLAELRKDAERILR